MTATNTSSHIHIHHGQVRCSGTEQECLASKAHWRGQGIVVANPAAAVTAAPAPAPRIEVAAPAKPAWEVAAATMTTQERIDVNAKRIRAHEAHLAKFGIVHAPPVYTMGRPVVGIGQDAVLARRAELDDMPLVVESLSRVAEQVESENRRDIAVDAHDLRMKDDGSIYRASNPKAGIMLENNGFSQLMSRMSDVFPRGNALMRHLRPAMRAQVFNDQVGRGRDTRLMMRLRQHPTTREWQLFGVVTPKYTRFDADKAAGVMRDALIASGHGDIRGEVILDPETTSLKVNGFYRVDARTDVSAGDIIQAGISMWTKDDGTGGIHGRGTSLRNRCLNLIILCHQGADLFSVAHKGGRDKMVAKMRAGIQEGGDFMSVFRDQWHVLGQAGVLDNLDVIGVSEKQAEVIQGLTGRQKLEALFDAVGSRLPVAKGQGSSILYAGWQAEPVDLERMSLRDLINAQTRVHEQKVPVLVSSKVEAHAGQQLNAWSRALA